MGMMTRQDAFNPFHLVTLARRSRPAREAAAGWARDEWETLAMQAMTELQRDVPPPSPEKMAAGKRRLLALAAERRRERFLDLAG
jgi:hypothetical protein